MCHRANQKERTKEQMEGESRAQAKKKTLTTSVVTHGKSLKHRTQQHAAKSRQFFGLYIQ
jgi:hypothetical protein